MVFKRNDNKLDFCKYCRWFSEVVYYIEMVGYIVQGNFNVRIHRDVTGVMWFGVVRDVFCCSNLACLLLNFNIKWTNLIHNLIVILFPMFVIIRLMLIDTGTSVAAGSPQIFGFVLITTPMALHTVLIVLNAFFNMLFPDS